MSQGDVNFNALYSEQGTKIKTLQAENCFTISCFVLFSDSQCRKHLHGIVRFFCDSTTSLIVIHTLGFGIVCRREGSFIVKRHCFDFSSLL